MGGGLLGCGGGIDGGGGSLFLGAGPGSWSWSAGYEIVSGSRHLASWMWQDARGDEMRNAIR
jgi:hypothetical protein